MDNAYYSEAYSITRNITDEKLIAVYEEFTNMVNAANAIVGDMDARYEAYADAEKYMIEHALVIPWYKNVLWQVTHVNDYSKIYAPYGIQGDKFKNWETSAGRLHHRGLRKAGRSLCRRHCQIRLKVSKIKCLSIP